jgi:solute carrier family 25 protein 39/40
MKKMIKDSGPRSAFRGMGSTLLRDIPYSGTLFCHFLIHSAIYWTIYENTKNARLKNQHSSGSSTSKFTDAFINGAVSGFVAALVTHPFDVSKTIQQVTTDDPVTGLKAKPESAFTILRRIFREEGVRGIYQGLGPRIVRVAPAGAIMISTYELFKDAFQ